MRLCIDPADGAMYTKEDFFACYGRHTEWDAAQTPYSEVPKPEPIYKATPLSLPTPTLSKPEQTRIDPADGQAYTKTDFHACYGGYKEWDAAAPKPVVISKRFDPTPEKRVDPADGRSYTKQEFKACYNGYLEWEAAAPKKVQARPAGRGRGLYKPPDRIDPADGNAYTRDNFFACYGGFSEWEHAVPYPVKVGRGRGRGAIEQEPELEELMV